MIDNDLQYVNNVNNDNNDNNTCIFSHELRPSTSASNRTSTRRKAIKPIPPRKKSFAMCIDCYNTIYVDDFFRTCNYCRQHLCKLCWDKNTNCVKCNRRLDKNKNLIPIKTRHFFTIFYKYFFCCFSR